MNPKEYRLGNLVRDEMDQVCEITQLQNGFKDENEICAWPIDGHPIISRPFKPIELTEEWFGKFGFEDNYSSFDKEPLALSWSRKIVSTGERKSFFLDGDLPENMRIKIDHVHQLQNVFFALTGEELELNQ